MIASITRGPRQSNIELLRILSMFLVLVVHADFWAFGAPTADDFSVNPLNAFTRVIIESVSIICVNVFILISGWFGIKPSVKGFLGYLFQCAFFLVGIYVLFLITGNAYLTTDGIMECLCLTQTYWFIKAYAALYILTPVLNSFVEKATEKQFRFTLIAFFIFQSIWGWTGAAVFVEGGYSCFSFIGLYLLARFVKIHGLRIVTSWGGSIYVFSIIVNTAAYYACLMSNLSIDIFLYANPLVILGALGLLCWFDSNKIKPNFYINWIARSSFAVYLLHINPNIGVPVFKDNILKIYAHYSGIECIMYIFALLLVIFIVAIIADQPRIILWRYISRKIISK